MKDSDYATICELLPVGTVGVRLAIVGRRNSEGLWSLADVEVRAVVLLMPDGTKDESPLDRPGKKLQEFAIVGQVSYV